MNLLIRNFTKTRIDVRSLEKVASSVLAEEKIFTEAEISLVFTGRERIRKLNRIYRGIDRVTDVLSFEGENEDGFVDPADGVSYLGEVFICVERAKKQAREKGHSLKKEIDILLIHGIFHLLGYDHMEDRDYEIMKKKEEKVFKKIYS